MNSNCLGPIGKSNEKSVSKQPRFGEVGARDTQISERGLEGRAVPERNSDRLFLCEAVGQVDIGRQWLLPLETDTHCRGACANRPIQVSLRGSTVRGCASQVEGHHDCRDDA